MERAKSTLRKQIGDNILLEECKCSTMGRNLVVCIDATWASFSDNSTNILKLYEALENDDKQITLYLNNDRDAGSYATPSWKSVKYYLLAVRRAIDLTFSRNLERHIISAYTWLCENYQPEDRIFLFGFARGAYQVRCLSAMINKVLQTSAPYQPWPLIDRHLDADRLVTPRTRAPNPSVRQYALKEVFPGIYSLSSGYELYANSEKSDTADKVASHFKGMFARSVKVHVVGAWDTTVPIPFNILSDNTLPGATYGMKHVCYFRHALALDERRVLYLPLYAHEGSSLSDNPDEAKVEADNRDTRTAHTKEVWFPGTHSDIGGRSHYSSFGLYGSQASLRWMSYEAIHEGLRMKPFGVAWTASLSSTNEDNLGIWWLFELLPMRRLSYSDNSRQSTRVPHMGEGRRIFPGQRIHGSLLYETSKEVDSCYEPKASLEYLVTSDPRSWKQLYSQGSRGSFVEPDPYLDAVELSGHFTSYSTVGESDAGSDLLNRLQRMVESTINARALLEVPELLDSLQAGGCLPTDVQSYALRTYQRLCGWNDYAVDILEAAKPGMPDASSSAVSANDRYIATAKLGTSEPGNIYLQLVSDENSNSSESVFECTGTHVVALAFSPLGTHIASSYWDRTMSLWTIETSGRALFGDADGLNSVVASIVFSPNGDRIASGSLNGAIMIWSCANQKKVDEAKGSLGGSITSLVFSHDGVVLASGSSDGTVCLWNVGLAPQVPLHRLHVFQGHTRAVISLAISSDNHHIASGSYDSSVRVWDVQTGDIRARVLYGHTGWVTAVAFSPDNTHVASGSSDTLICVWDTAAARNTGPPITSSTDWISSVEFSGDGQSIISRTTDGQRSINHFDILDSAWESLYGHRGSVNAVAFSPTDPNRLVSCSHDHTIRIWDVSTGTESRRPLQGHTEPIWSVKYAPDGKTIVSGADDKTIRMWDTETGKAIGQPIRDHRGGVNSVSFSPDGKHIASGSDDCTVRIRNVDNPHEDYWSLTGHTGRIWSAQYSPDGRTVVSASEDQTVRLWDVETEEAVGGALHRHESQALCCAYAPNGTCVVSGWMDATIRVLDVVGARKGMVVGESMQGHTNWVRSVAFSPDGNYIVSSSEDLTIRLWDLRMRREVIEPLSGQSDTLWSAVFSPDGHRIASASYDKTIRLWDVHVQQKNVVEVEVVANSFKL